MSPKVSLIIEIILHATEDVNKIENALQNIFDINTEDLEYFGSLLSNLTVSAQMAAIADEEINENNENL